MVGSVFADDVRFELESHDIWKSRMLPPMNHTGYICAAGIAGDRNCNNAPMRAVMDANVGLPLSMMYAARAADAPLIVLSSTGVYRRHTRPCDEDDDLHPHNRYIASKIAMEYALKEYDRCYILRLPFVTLFEGAWHFGTRCAAWKRCESVLSSVLFQRDLMNVVSRVLDGDVPSGIYNIASHVVHLPDFIRAHFQWNGEVVRQGELGLCPCAQVRLTKAKGAGLYG